MTFVNKILKKMDYYDQNKNQEKLDRIFSDRNNAYGGDLLTAAVKAQRMKITEVASTCGMELRVFQNIRSKKAHNRREITKFEAMRIAVVLNLPPKYAKLLLERMHFALPTLTENDKALAAVIFTNHLTNKEMRTRLECLEIINKHYLDFSFDFKAAFKRLEKN